MRASIQQDWKIGGMSRKRLLSRAGHVWGKGRARVLWGKGKGMREDKGGALVEASANLVWEKG